MQKLLLELGGPLVFAFVLLAIAKFVRGVIESRKNPNIIENEVINEVETEEQLEDPTENDPRAT
jgi:hypothetical protein